MLFCWFFAFGMSWRLVWTRGVTWLRKPGGCSLTTLIALGRRHCLTPIAVTRLWADLLSWKCDTYLLDSPLVIICKPVLFLIRRQNFALNVPFSRTHCACNRYTWIWVFLFFFLYTWFYHFYVLLQVWTMLASWNVPIYKLADKNYLYDQSVWFSLLFFNHSTLLYKIL